MSWWRRSLGAIALLPLLACSSSDGSDTGDDEAITNIPESSVKDQSDTGNCWLYATAAWAESLSADPATGRTKDYSTTYLVYWNFYDQILQSEKGFHGVEWTGGSWGEAAELILKRGLMELRDFTGSTGEEADAKLALSALTAVNKSLKSGTLKTSAARKDPLAVRRELDKAFKLGQATVRAMNAVFGEDGARTLDAGATASGKIVAPSAVSVRLPTPAGTDPSYGTLVDVIGTRQADDPDVRAGQFAWSRASLEDEDRPDARAAKMRAYLKRVQRALHDGVPVPIAWCVEDTGEDDKKNYSKALSGVQDGDCGHETLAVDYQAKLPDGRVLPAGTPASPEDEAAALSDDTQIIFIRVKNSWGKSDASPTGYTDLYLDYLMSSIKACPNKDGSSKDCESYSFMTDEVTLPTGY